MADSRYLAGPIRLVTEKRTVEEIRRQVDERIAAALSEA